MSDRKTDRRTKDHYTLPQTIFKEHSQHGTVQQQLGPKTIRNIVLIQYDLPKIEIG